jgi:Tol biopolymer transport system component
VLLSDLWTYDLARGQLTRLSFDGRSFDRSVAWMPDGRRLIYSAVTADNMLRFYAIDAKGSAVPTALFEAPPGAGVPLVTSVSPDGREIIGFAGGGGRPRIWSRPLAAATAADSGFRLFLDPRMVEMDPQFSPDGRWVAYSSNRSGRPEVWVAPYAGPGGPWQVSSDGGRMPRWSADGRELFYRGGDRLMAVDVETSTTFRSATPRMLFEGAYDIDYDVSRDGQRFLMIRPGGDRVRPLGDQSRELHIVVNWFEELRRQVPLEQAD